MPLYEASTVVMLRADRRRGGTNVAGKAEVAMMADKAGKEDERGGRMLRVPCTRDRVLIVDDETCIREVFGQILSFELPDCTVDSAVNGEDALSAFLGAHQSVVLMDLHMPVMDGQTAFFEIRKICEKNNWEMPSVVFCTGYEPPEVVASVASRKSHNDHCLLRKPVTTEKLINTIKTRLDR